VSAAAIAFVLFVASGALAKPHLRKHFEPTDLDLEAPGITSLDVQVGAVRSQDAWRIVIPDFEVDVGLTHFLELDIDGAYAVEGEPGRPFTLDHAAPDSLWPSLKLGLADWNDRVKGQTYAFGGQLGPKLPTFPGGHGVGVEGLMLAGIASKSERIALNVGGFIDPANDASNARPVGLEAGLDWSNNLDDAGIYSLDAGASGVKFLSHDPTQLQLAFGPGYSPYPWLDLSLTALLGLLPGSDRFGLLLGVSPEFAVW
jgi:hypothetical protein